MKFCNGYGSALSVKVVLKLGEVRKKTDRLMTELVKRPEIVEAIMNALGNLKD